MTFRTINNRTFQKNITFDDINKWTDGNIVVDLINNAQGGISTRYISEVAEEFYQNHLPKCFLLFLTTLKIFRLALSWCLTLGKNYTIISIIKEYNYRQNMSYFQLSHVAYFRNVLAIFPHTLVLCGMMFGVNDIRYEVDHFIALSGMMTLKYWFIIATVCHPVTHETFLMFTVFIRRTTFVVHVVFLYLMFFANSTMYIQSLSIMYFPVASITAFYLIHYCILQFFRYSLPPAGRIVLPSAFVHNRYCVFFYSVFMFIRLLENAKKFLFPDILYTLGLVFPSFISLYEFTWLISTNSHFNYCYMIHTLELPILPEYLYNEGMELDHTVNSAWQCI